MSKILAIGRHEDYSRATKWPLSEWGIARAWLSAGIIKEMLGQPDEIISSPLPRAQATAIIRAKVWNHPQVSISEALDECTPALDVEEFRINLLEKAVNEEDEVIHLLSHAPTINYFNGGKRTLLSTGDIMVYTAPHWEDILNGSHKTFILNPSEFIDNYKISQLEEKIKSIKAESLNNLLDQL